ncbi:MAG: hypothetical protein JW834_01435 [Candidatus Diapherotrites archaeon]|nr:hypothetical protein [Candidatus Diapherotrites archaeon]
MPEARRSMKPKIISELWTPEGREQARAQHELFKSQLKATSNWSLRQLRGAWRDYRMVKGIAERSELEHGLEDLVGKRVWLKPHERQVIRNGLGIEPSLWMKGEHLQRTYSEALKKLSKSVGQAPLPGAEGPVPELAEDIGGKQLEPAPIPSERSPVVQRILNSMGTQPEATFVGVQPLVAEPLAEGMLRVDPRHVLKAQSSLGRLADLIAPPTRKAGSGEISYDHYNMLQKLFLPHAAMDEWAEADRLKDMIGMYAGRKAVEDIESIQDRLERGRSVDAKELAGVAEHLKAYDAAKLKAVGERAVREGKFRDLDEFLEKHGYEPSAVQREEGGPQPESAERLRELLDDVGLKPGQWGQELDEKRARFSTEQRLLSARLASNMLKAARAKQGSPRAEDEAGRKQALSELGVRDWISIADALREAIKGYDVDRLESEGKLGHVYEELVAKSGLSNASARHVVDHLVEEVSPEELQQFADGAKSLVELNEKYVEHAAALEKKAKDLGEAFEKAGSVKDKESVLSRMQAIMVSADKYQQGLQKGVGEVASQKMPGSVREEDVLNLVSEAQERLGLAIDAIKQKYRALKASVGRESSGEINLRTIDSLLEGLGENLRDPSKVKEIAMRIAELNPSPEQISDLILVQSEGADKEDAKFIVVKEALERMSRKDSGIVSSVESVLRSGYEDAPEWNNAASVFRRITGKDITKPRGIEGIMKDLTNTDVAVRQDTARKLGEIGSKEVVLPLLTLLGDEDSGVQHVAASSLKQVAASSLRQVIPGLEPLKQKGAIQLLRDSGAPAAVGWIQEISASTTNPVIRQYAEEALDILRGKSQRPERKPKE